MSDSQPERQADRYFVIIVMGVCGTGKSTLATALAREWDMDFVEGDELHPKANIEKMSSGRSLNDQDREPWLECIMKTVEQRRIQRRGGRWGPCRGLVVTCSALKKYYRDILRGRLKLPRDGVNPSENPLPAASLATYFVYIKGSKELILQRLQERKGHYMKSDMLDSQLHDLESPEGEGDVVVVNADDTTKSQTHEATEKIMALAGLTPPTYTDTDLYE